MEPETVVPQKRKVAEANKEPTKAAPAESSAADSASDSQSQKNEYENGHVTCEACSEEISFRDEATGGFTVKHWDLHRQQCSSATNSITVAEPVMYTPDSQSETSAPLAKKRRAKRSEEERIDYLRSDPYVAQFEAYRVLCASCDKWIRLRPNSTYCSIPWDAHRKSCLAKKSKGITTSDNRGGVFANDPYVRKFDSERVLCKLCEVWIPLGADNNMVAVQTWMRHKASCLQSKTASTSSAPSSASAAIPTIDSVPPPSKHLMALVSSSAILSPPLPTLSPKLKGTTSSSSSAPKVSSASFKDLNPTNFPPTQESRRRNAEQRAAALRADSLISQVEPNRVFCSLCRKWVQLRQDSSYCAYPWMQHRGKCLNRQQKRSQKEAELAEYRAQMDALQREQKRKMEEASQDSEDPESEEGADEDDEDAKRRRVERRAERRRAKQLAKAAELKKMEERKALLENKAKAVMNDSDGDEDAEGEIDIDYEDFPPQLADLESPAGRLDFTHRSIRYLFKTTYGRGDELTIASLVTYLNAAIPADKHEDFDTTEVTKAATALHDRGDILFEGDIVRLPED